MARFDLASFQQARLLRSDEEGVCVALCDFWLRTFLDQPSVLPRHRMAYLAGLIDQARSHQAAYGGLRAALGPEDARQEVGRGLGIDYEARTTIVQLRVGQTGMLAKLAGDLKPIGSAATWSMRFLAGGGHAIAGINRIESMTSNMHRAVFHVFDPNIGEYSGPTDVLPEILSDLFTRVPDYADTMEVRRMSAMKI